MKRIQGFGQIVCVFSKIKKVMVRQNVARSSSRSKKNKKTQFLIPLRALSFVLVVDMIAIAVAFLAVGEDTGDIILQTVLFPLASFVSGFFALVSTKHVVACLLSSAVGSTLMYCIMFGFGWSAIFWILLYLISSFVGLSVAYIVLTHKSS